MSEPFDRTVWSISVDRAAAVPIADQIHGSLRAAILEGQLKPGTRLPSGRDLAAQLGVARGTVRSAYERLGNEALVFGAGAAGSRVADLPQPVCASATERLQFARPLPGFIHEFSSKPLPFQMGVPSYDAFPAKVWAKFRTKAVREDALAYTTYADPRGEPELRDQIASHLVITRRLNCVPDQVIVTSGYRHGLGLTLQTLQARGRTAWVENPGYPIGRRSLELAGLNVVPVRVDECGIVVADGMAQAPDALLALVTPGQQAPLGMPLPSGRRREILDWASASSGWILEDDYLSELQLHGRASPALASGDGAERVIHIGSFSKTLSPSLGLGFVVAPPALVDRMTEHAAIAFPAPNRTTQLAVADFMADGHYLRHLRQMKALYAQRCELLTSHLAPQTTKPVMSGLALLLELPADTDDVKLARDALDLGICPAALSPWYMSSAEIRKGLLLGVTNLRSNHIAKDVNSLRKLLQEHR